MPPPKSHLDGLYETKSDALAYGMTTSKDPFNDDNIITSISAKTSKLGQGLREQDEPAEPPKWHPFWLRWAVLGTFCALFASVAAALVIIAIYSRLNDGLTDAHDDLAYVWKFGPTACEPPSPIIEDI